MKKIFVKGKVKFFLYSLLGIIYFFMPFHSGKTLLMISVSALKNTGWINLPLTVILLNTVFCLLVLFKPPIPQIKKHIGDKNLINKLLYFSGSIIGIMTLFKTGPGFLIRSDIGGTALSLATDVFVTIFLAGTVVTLIVSFGFLQFVGCLIEPFMRPLFNLPGHAGMDIATSVMTAPSVDVYLSSKIYMQGLYTKREVSAVVTSFSLCSLGFYAIICELAGITQYYGQVVITSLVISFIIPLITVRIPPISRIPNEYVDGTMVEEIMIKNSKSKQHIFHQAWTLALSVSTKTSSMEIINGIVDSAFMAIKIVGYILSVATVALMISIYTPIFQWIGILFVPILKVFGIPNATEIAPSVLAGICDLTLPTLLIAGSEVAPSASFFIVVLSTLQIIFFTGSANAIMESSIPLNVWELIVIFFIRTFIAIPLVAIAMHLTF